MRIKFYLGLWLLLVIGSSLVSCKKDTSAKTRTELLTAGSWKRTALTSNPAYDWYANGTSGTDILAYMWPCEKDNFDTYRTYGMIETNEGLSRCDPSDPQTWSVTWEFVNNETAIRFDNSYEYIIDELTETILRLRATFEENSVTYTHYESYSH